MLKGIAAALVLSTVVATGSLVHAQNIPAGARQMMNWRPSAEDRAAFTEARLAALHAGLTLTPEQEKNWPAAESALRDLAKLRAERFAARTKADQPNQPRNWIERLNLRADMTEQRGAALKKLATAAGPLYNSLDEAQKRRFVVIARFTHIAGTGHHGGRRAWFRGEGPGRRGGGEPQMPSPQ
jgi:zinc resistance-associated protein